MVWTRGSGAEDGAAHHPLRSARVLDWLRSGYETALVATRVAVGAGVATGALLQIVPDLAEQASELHRNHERAARAGADGFQTFDDLQRHRLRVHQLRGGEHRL